MLTRAQPFYYADLKLEPKQINCTEAIQIAVLDDAFDLNHPSLIPYYQKNGGDTLINGLDENADGFVDNPIGYDFADHDGDPSAPLGLEKIFHHGNLILGEMVSIWTHLYGAKASDCFKIIPIKVFTKEGQLPIFRNVDESLKLLAKLKPDLILTSWSMGALSNEVELVVRNILQNDLIWVASAGNFSTPQPQYPAAFKRIVSVGAVDKNKKLLKKSNYGSWVDLANYGVENLGFVNPTIYDGLTEVKIDGQTSSAAAITLAMLAAIKIEFPKKSNDEVLRAFYLSSQQVDNQDLFVSQINWGIPNLHKTREILSGKGYFQNENSQTGFLTQGSFFEASDLDTLLITPWEFQRPKSIDDSLKIYRDENLFGVATISEWFKLKDEIKIPLKENIRVRYEGESPLVYHILPVDSSRIWCGELKEIIATKGVLSDGSSKESLDYKYSSFSNCKWLLKAPDSMRVLITFKNFDTELNADPLYFFAGAETIQTQMIGRFSGDELPPQIISPTNEVLVWFLTDAQNEKMGWSFDYEFVDSTLFKPSFIVPK